ncbi:MAG TPA: 30S ribosomal protein S15 [Methanothrix soehngenii]|jgi:small subunit ribosomal protein S15|uniref:Small ribosomal subunit protein uS15 n=2 Tax=root TaxID=1 RepID=F4BX79_METSG|nr:MULTISPECIES: 30S ribosomal protein S15 [Methanothrix]OPX77832.1 MAG: 30S ribosomal protein S15 [Methanosaeta sp. PtaB.Bin005]HQJ29460.1 30S ribosomal protein S15 [Methanotrichaceae archaeon]AEB68635.1 30S ribosomal protein S15P/S13e [Methanothrix soehngenii GP6]MBP7069035.1 30S ribosomal protein S15 [Methanothrix sp.]MDD3550852.1 30S ribosomal protein S15 [Methanothrix soehngenii]
MAKMHSRKGGSSRSRPPMVTKAPEWSDVSKEELEKTIMKLHDTGMSPSRIGLTLRDQYGVPNVKLVIGNSITGFLRDNNALADIPEDLTNLMRKALHVRKHIKANKKDVHNKRALQLTENKIRRMVKYYHDSGRLAPDWTYSPETAEILIS